MLWVLVWCGGGGVGCVRVGVGDGDTHADLHLMHSDLSAKHRLLLAHACKCMLLGFECERICLCPSHRLQTWGSWMKLSEQGSASYCAGSPPFSG